MDIVLFIIGLILFFGGIITLVLRPCCYDMEGIAILMIIGGLIFMTGSFFVDLETVSQDLTCNCGLI